MSEKKRVGLGLDVDVQELHESQIDIEEVIGGQNSPKPTFRQQANIYKEAEKIGFVRRQPKKRRQVSPYTDQFGGRCREGMKELFKDIGDRMGRYDNEVIEKAIFALLEKEGFDDLIVRYMELVESSVSHRKN